VAFICIHATTHTHQSIYEQTKLTVQHINICQIPYCKLHSWSKNKFCCHC